jgi:hypothetical protein
LKIWEVIYKKKSNYDRKGVAAQKDDLKSFLKKIAISDFLGRYLIFRGSVGTLYVLYFTKGFQGIKNHQKSKADTSQEHIGHLNTPPHLLTL